MTSIGNLHNARSKRKWMTEVELGNIGGGSGGGSGAAPSNANPLPAGSAAPGSSLNYARGDHVHPLQPVATPSDATPLAPGTAAAGSSLSYARGDHAHPQQVVPAAGTSTPVASGATPFVGVATAYAREDHRHQQQDLTPYTLADGTVPFTGQITVPDGTTAPKAVNKGQLDAAIAGVSGGGTPSNTNPLAPGTAAPGVATTYSRGDHVHPAQSLAAGWSGSGSIAQTYEQALLDRPLSVGGYGAVGNGTTDDTAAIQALINATPAGQEILLDGGKFYSVSNLTLQNYTKINGCGAILEARAGTTAVFTVPTGVPLQTANRLIISNLVIDGKDVAGVRGIDALNHASLVIQNVGIKRCDVGLYVVGAQFGTAYSLRCWDNVIGLYLRGHPTAGGANSWSFYDLSCVGNTVGMVVNRAEYTTSHSNYFRNPVLLDNSVCAAAFFNCYDATLDGCSNELNADGAATHVFDSLTIKKASIYVSQGHLQLVNPRISEADANPCILLENGATLSAIGTLSGYGSTQGELIQCLDTSLAQIGDVKDCVGTVAAPAGINGTIISQNCVFVLPATTFITDSIPNDVADPYMSSVDHTGATSASTVTDSEMGPAREVVFAASASTSTSNRVRFNVAAGSTPRRALAFSVKSSVDTRLGVGWDGTTANKFIKIKAGVWCRVLHITDLVTAGSHHFHIWAPDADGPTVRFTRWQQASGAVAQRLIGAISAMSRGALNAPVTGGGGGTPSDAAPQPLGTAAAGSSTDYSRGDHVHPVIRLPWFVRGSVPPATAAAARSFEAGLSTPGEVLPTYSFSGSVDNTMDFYGQAPSDLVAGDVTVSFYVLNLAGTSSASDWTVGLRRLAGGDVLASFSYPVDTASTGTLTANVPVKLTFTIAAADVGVLAGEPFVLRVKRLGLTDTLVDSLRLQSFSVTVQ